MGRQIKSARGQAVDFDVLSIKQQLASVVEPTSVSARRDFIDMRDGLKVKRVEPAAAIRAVIPAATPEQLAATTVKAKKAKTTETQDEVSNVTE